MAMAFDRFLMVCTGNICRSPMGEWMLQERLSDRDGVRVASAGIGALVDEPADEKAIAVMQEKGFDLSAHRGRQLDLDLASDFDLLLVMEPHQKRWIERRFPVLRGRVQGIGHWLGADVPDPFGRSIDEFRAARDLIERAVDSWIERVF